MILFQCRVRVALVILLLLATSTASPFRMSSPFPHAHTPTLPAPVHLTLLSQRFEFFLWTPMRVELVSSTCILDCLRQCSCAPRSCFAALEPLAFTSMFALACACHYTSVSALAVAGVAPELLQLLALHCVFAVVYSGPSSILQVHVRSRAFFFVLEFCLRALLSFAPIHARMCL